MARLALAGALLMFVVLLSSAYLRLVQGGVGCSDWPECYGTARLAQTRRPSTAPPVVQWVRVSHRFAATAVAAIVTAVLVIALRKPRRRTAVTMAALLAALTLFLAVLGIATPHSTLPAVTLGNVLGGMAMLGLFWWLRLESVTAPRAPDFSQRALMYWGCGLALLALQIALGALVNANFASLACPDLPFCGGSWWPGTWEWAAFDLWRKVAAPAAGDPILHTLHAAHRWGALLVTLYWSALAATRLGRRAPGRGSWLALTAALGAQLVLGIVLVRLEAPLLAAVAHNAGGALLLLAALAVAFYSRPAVVADVSAACQTVTSK